jgi:hypothetical protein
LHAAVSGTNRKGVLQQPPDPATTEFRFDGDTEFGRLEVDVAVSVLVVGEESCNRRSGGPSSVVRRPSSVVRSP